MVELSSLQQILSMSSGPEKVQQVQQQQPDTHGRQFANEMRELTDLQKTKVQESEEGNQSNLVGDKKEPGGRRKGKKRKAAVNNSSRTDEEVKKVDEVRQGKIVDILI